MVGVACSYKSCNEKDSEHITLRRKVNVKFFKMFDFQIYYRDVHLSCKKRFCFMFCFNFCYSQTIWEYYVINCNWITTCRRFLHWEEGYCEIMHHYTKLHCDHTRFQPTCPKFVLAYRQHILLLRLAIKILNVT